LAFQKYLNLKMNKFFKWHERMIDNISSQFNLSKYQMLILTWLEGILIGVIMCKFIF